MKTYHRVVRRFSFLRLAASLRTNLAGLASRVTKTRRETADESGSRRRCHPNRTLPRLRRRPSRKSPACAESCREPEAIQRREERRLETKIGGWDKAARRGPRRDRAKF